MVGASRGEATRTEGDFPFVPACRVASPLRRVICTNRNCTRSGFAVGGGEGTTPDVGKERIGVVCWPGFTIRFFLLSGVVSLGQVDATTLLPAINYRRTSAAICLASSPVNAPVKPGDWPTDLQPVVASPLTRQRVVAGVVGVPGLRSDRPAPRDRRQC